MCSCKKKRRPHQRRIQGDSLFRLPQSQVDGLHRRSRFRPGRELRSPERGYGGRSPQPSALQHHGDQDAKQRLHVQAQSLYIGGQVKD